MEDNKTTLDNEVSSSNVESEFVNENENLSKKPKKKMTKKAKIAMWVAIGLVAAIIIGLGSWLIAIAVGGKSPAVDADNLIVFMNNTHYVGENGTIDLSVTFKDKTVTLPNTNSATLSGNILTITGKNKFTLKVNEDTVTVTVVAGGYNVTEYNDMFDKIVESKIVVIQAPDLTMTAEKGTIYLKNDLYGNGCKLNAYAVTRAAPNGGNPLKLPGSTAISINSTTAVTLRDIHVTGKIYEEGDTIKTYNNYGSILDISTGVDASGKKATANVIHSIFENSHKVVHISNSNVNMEGCIIRNASDTTLSMATIANGATTLNLKNNVIANSLTGGITIYGMDGEINASTDNDKTWNVINIEGFLDIYNWVNTLELTILPDTEAGTGLGAIANTAIRSEIQPIKNHLDKKVTVGTKQYIHFGILKIFTGNNFNENKSIINGLDGVDYKIEKLPLPDLAKDMLKDCVVSGYYNNNNSDVKVGQTISDNKKLYVELIRGR